MNTPNPIILSNPGARLSARRLAGLAAVLAGLLLLPIVGRAQSGSLAANSATYLATPDAVTFTVTMNYPAISVLGTHIDLPTGWSYASTDLSSSGLTALVSPVFGDTVAAEWAFSAFPASTATFHFDLNYLGGLTGPQTINGFFNLDGATDVPFTAPVILTSAAVPEPATTALILGALGVGLVAWLRLRS